MIAMDEPRPSQAKPARKPPRKAGKAAKAAGAASEAAAVVSVAVSARVGEAHTFALALAGFLREPFPARRPRYLCSFREGARPTFFYDILKSEPGPDEGVLGMSARASESESLFDAALTTSEWAVLQAISERGEGGATLEELRASLSETVPTLVVSLIELVRKERVRLEYSAEGRVLDSNASVLAASREANTDGFVLRYVATDR